MALKPTIYKLQLHISDFDRDVYASPNLTLAQHPSETLERLCARVIAYCLNYSDELMFTAGLSTPDEPDIRLNSLDGRTLLWLDMGEPTVDRIKKAVPQAEALSVYSFNTKADVWWRENAKPFEALGAQYFQLNWDGIKTLANDVERNMEWMVSISSNVLTVTVGDNSVDISVQELSR